jgi:hypothetical protein
MGAVQNNPEGLLLLAAGCALLLRSGGSRESGKRSLESTGAGGVQRSSDPHQRQRSPGISETFSEATEGAREYAADLGKTVGDKAGTYASTVSDKASSYVSAVGEYADEAWRSSERMVGQVRSTMHGSISRVLQEQPLALAAAGLAAGAMVAATFPATAVERRTLGPAGERFSEAASSAGQQISEAASKAGERLMSVADERGLNTQGLKDAATDVAGAFTGALAGEPPKNPGAEPGNATGSGQKAKLLPVLP